MKIAFIGTRGVPAQYGGFETCAEELGKRIVQRGHEVCVYGRSGYYKERPKKYLGMELIYLPALNIRFIETFSHTFFSLIHAIWRRYDIFLVFNSANSPLLIFPKMLRKKVVLHVDGLEWKREKWGTLGKKSHKFAEWLATKLSIELISDSAEIKKYYREKHRKETHYISYGASLQLSRNEWILEQFGIEPKEYFLQITRFEPENNPLLSIKAFEMLKTDKKLVFVGGVRYKTKYSEEICSTKDKRIKFLGFVYDKDILRELFCNCFTYIHGNEVGGTNPALLEAMASGCFVICRDVPFNREVLQDAGIYFEKDVNDLKAKLSWSLQNHRQIGIMKKKAGDIIKKNYNWDSVVSDYEELFKKLSLKN